MTQQASRWINQHSKKKECRDAHQEAFLQFKQRKDAKITEQTPPAQSSNSSVQDLWDKLKAKRDYRDMCCDVELCEKENYEMDSDNEGDYVFDPAVCIMKLFKDASEYKKQYDKIRASFSAYEAEQISKENKYSNRILELETIITNMKAKVSEPETTN